MASHAFPPSTTSMATQLASGVKRAVLVGITYAGTEQALRGPQNDVVDIYNLLTTQYHYHPSNITVLLDDKPDNFQVPCSLPTEDALLAALQNMTKGAKPGDKFLFQFSGHTTQRKNLDHTEEDGLDEAIIPYDPNGGDHVILDDLLKKYLVDPLPLGSQLIAILDTCHSATLLDLPHHRCNQRIFQTQRQHIAASSPTIQVYVEVSRFPNPKEIGSARTEYLASPVAMSPQKSITLASSDTRLPVTQAGEMKGYEDGNVRRLKDYMSPVLMLLSNQRRMSGFLLAATGIYRAVRTLLFTRRIQGIADVGQSACTNETQPCNKTHDLAKSQVKPAPAEVGRSRGTSALAVQCLGDCLTGQVATGARVVCISACKDRQGALEDGHGRSMTRVMAKYLRNNPRPPLKNIMGHLSQTVHEWSLIARAMECKMNRPRTNAALYPEPQIASLQPLNYDDSLDI